MDRAFRIASPCSADWNRMQGDDRTRYCPECRLNVYNFSAMTGPEIEKLLAERDGRLCARFYRRSDGTILTQDCPVGFRATVRRVSKFAGAALAAAMSVFATAQNPPNASSLVQIASHTTQLEIDVADPSGAEIPGAVVRLVNVAVKQERNGTTDKWGRLKISGLDIGDYELTVEGHGFKKYDQVLTISERTTVNVRLELGTVEMGVFVEPAVESVNTELTNPYEHDTISPKPSDSLDDLPPARKHPAKRSSNTVPRQ